MLLQQSIILDMGIADYITKRSQQRKLAKPIWMFWKDITRQHLLSKYIFQVQPFHSLNSFGPHPKQLQLLMRSILLTISSYLFCIIARTPKVVKVKVQGDITCTATIVRQLKIGALSQIRYLTSFLLDPTIEDSSSLPIPQKFPINDPNPITYSTKTSGHPPLIIQNLIHSHQ